MQKQLTSVGIDLSLAKSGWAVVTDTGKILDSGLVKSKPTSSLIEETRRILKIIEDILEKVSITLPSAPPTIVCIEGLAFLARGTSLTQLAGLHHLLRVKCVELEWPFIVISPQSLKKFVTGSGKGDKDKMMMCIYRDYGFEAFDNNVNDALSLGVCGMALLGKPLKSLTQPQTEVVNLLKKQL